MARELESPSTEFPGLDFNHDCKSYLAGGSKPANKGPVQLLLEGKMRLID